MRIAQVIASLDPDMGGLPRAAVSMSSSLAMAGEDVALIFYASPEEMRETEAAFASLPGYSRVRKMALPRPRFPGWTDGALRVALAEFSPEVIHTHGVWEPMLAQAQRFALRRGVPFVICAHSMLHPWQARKHRFLKWILMVPAGFRRLWQRAAWVQVLNAAEAADWRRLGVSRTRLIANGIFPEEDRGPGAVAWPGRFLLSLARLDAQKSPDLLLEAFAGMADRHPDLQLVLAGPDYGMKGALQSRTAQLGLMERVHFPGSLRGEAKWAALHACAGFCLPSQAEGFSLAVLEAALAGAPILISAGCHFPELVAAGGAREAPLTPEGLREGLEVLLRDDGTMGASARALVISDYSWTAMAARLQTAYAEAGG